MEGLDMTEKRFVKELVEYAKGNKEWENIIDEDGTDGYKITEDGRLVVIHEEDADHYTAKLSIDSMNFDLCGMTALERKIDVILRFFYAETSEEMIKEYMNV
jgi:hypothetical protein